MCCLNDLGQYDLNYWAWLLQRYHKNLRPHDITQQSTFQGLSFPSSTGMVSYDNFTFFIHPTDCGKDQFTCKNMRCIPRFFTCDGINDCNDGSDESATTCSKFCWIVLSICVMRINWKGSMFVVFCGPRMKRSWRKCMVVLVCRFIWVSECVYVCKCVCGHSWLLIDPVRSQSYDSHLLIKNISEHRLVLSTYCNLSEPRVIFCSVVAAHSIECTFNQSYMCGYDIIDQGYPQVWERQSVVEAGINVSASPLGMWHIFSSLPFPPPPTRHAG